MRTATATTNTVTMLAATVPAKVITNSRVSALVKLKPVGLGLSLLVGCLLGNGRSVVAVPAETTATSGVLRLADRGNSSSFPPPEPGPPAPRPCLAPPSPSFPPHNPHTPPT